MKKQGSIQVTLVGKGGPKSCLRCANRAPANCPFKLEFDHGPNFDTDNKEVLCESWCQVTAACCRRYEAVK